ncbi:MAG: 2-oxoacid:acceptor oxidoreductase subunit alpha, partial [Gemmatimonadales bacterium]|nr:2-oxoacid:acceptor oxidoreductase subunit alpha [Gemmatimonadales bacterium]
RRYTKLPPDRYQPFQPGDDGIPDLVKAGDGYHFHVTGLTHDYMGYPAMNAASQQELVSRLVRKIRNNADKIVEFEE